MPVPSGKPRHAVVIGGSLAGMCVARALADHVERVTVIDRDRFPEAPEVRRGVPQAHHLHVLITAGQRALERLFPGLLDELRKAGAVPVAVPTDVLYLSGTGWKQRFPDATHQLLGASRELIDFTVLQRLRGDERIRFLPAHDVIGLLPAGSAGTGSADDGPEGRGPGSNGPGNKGPGSKGPEGWGPAVGGVRLRPRPNATGTGESPDQNPVGAQNDADTADTGNSTGTGSSTGDGVRELVADLVVDASGRGSRTPEWLAALGYPQPAQTRIDAGLGYASRRYVLPESALGSWKNILVMPDRSGRGGVLYPIENDRWMLTLGGLGDNRPPTDDAGFLEFVRGLRTPVLYEAVKDGRPDSPIHGFAQTSNTRRHYESMRRWPDNFVVVGDAACSFNPVYGQGMSVASQTAVALGEHLRARPAGAPLLDRTAQAIAARCASVAWLIATGADARYLTTPETRSGLRDRFSHRYLDRASDVANHDPYVNQVLNDVMHLIASPSALMRPRVMARVLRGRRAPQIWTPPEPNPLRGTDS